MAAVGVADGCAKIRRAPNTWKYLEILLECLEISENADEKHEIFEKIPGNIW